MAAEMNLTLAIKGTVDPKVQQAISQINQINAQLAKSNKEAAKTGREATQEIQRGAPGAERGLRGVDRQAKATGKSVQQVGQFGKFAFDVLQAFLLYKGFVFLKTQAQEFVRELVDMQHQIAVTQGMLSGLGRDFQKDLGDAVISVSRETGQALGDLARAQYTVISGGVTDVAQSLEALNLAAKAAVAGGIQDVDTAFGAALSQIRAFGLGMDDLEDVFNKQFMLIRRGIFTYENFATSVGTISEAFSSMGQDMETANAALVAVSQVFTGPQLARGATALRNAVLQINRASEEFEGLGVQVFDAEGNFRNFLTIVEDLDDALEGMTDKERRKAMEELFPDKRQMAGMNVLLSNLDIAKESMIEQEFATGALNDEFASTSETLRVQAGIFKNELIPAAEPLVAIFGAVIEGTNEMNKEFDGFTKTVGVLTVAIAGLTAAHAALRSQQIAQANDQRFLLGRGGRAAVRGGIAGMVGLGAVGAGATQGFSPAGMLTSLGTGAAAGAFVGGPVGALVGAGLSGLLFGVSSAFKEEGEEVGKSFTDAFKDELVSSSGDIASALVAGVAARDSGSSPLDIVAEAAQGEDFIDVLARESAMDRIANRGFFENLARHAKRRFLPFSDDADSVDFDLSGMERLMVESGNVADATITLRDKLIDFEETVDRFGEAMNLTAKDVTDARAALVEETLNEILPDLPMEGAQEVQESRRSLAEMLARPELDNRQINEILSIMGTGRLPDGSIPSVVEPQEVEGSGLITGDPMEIRLPPEVGRESVLVAMDHLNAILEDLAEEAAGTFEGMMDKHSDFISAPFAEAAEVFAKMGDEGDLLAREFQELARIADKMKALQVIESLVKGLESFGDDVISSEQSEAIANALTGVMVDLVEQVAPEGLDSLADQDFVSSLADALTTIDTTTEALEPFAAEIQSLTDEMRGNSLEARRIQAQAKVQNRELTAEEQDHINRLELENTQLEIHRHNLEQFGESLVRAAEAAEEFTERASGEMKEGGQSKTASSAPIDPGLMIAQGLMLDPVTGQAVPGRGDKNRPGMTIEDVRNKARGSGIHGIFNIPGPQTLGDTLQNLKFHRHHGRWSGAGLMGTSAVSPQILDALDFLGVEQDRGRGAFKRQRGFGSDTQQLMRQLIDRFEDAARRGVNITFQGDTVPSELDMRIRQLEEMAPILVRGSNRGR